MIVLHTFLYYRCSIIIASIQSIYYCDYNTPFSVMQLLAYSAAYTLAPNLNNNAVFPKSVLRPPHNRCFVIYLPRRTGHGRAVSGEKISQLRGASWRCCDTGGRLQLVFKKRGSGKRSRCEGGLFAYWRTSYYIYMYIMPLALFTFKSAHKVRRASSKSGWLFERAASLRWFLERRFVKWIKCAIEKTVFCIFKGQIRR